MNVQMSEWDVLSDTNRGSVRSMLGMYGTFSMKRILALFLVLVGAAAGVFTYVQMGHVKATNAQVQPEGIQLPIIMYHSMLRNGSGNTRFRRRPLKRTSAI